MPFSPPGPLLAVLRERVLWGRGALCRQLFLSLWLEPFLGLHPLPLRSAELPLPPLLFPLGPAPSFGPRLQKIHAPHTCIFSCDLRSPACPFSTALFPACTRLGLPDLPYLFVRCVSECIRVAPPLPFMRAHPSCFWANRAPPDSACLRLFPPFLALSSPVTPTLATNRGAKGGVVYRNALWSPAPPLEGRGLVHM